MDDPVIVLREKTLGVRLLNGITMRKHVFCSFLQRKKHYYLYTTVQIFGFHNFQKKQDFLVLENYLFQDKWLEITKIKHNYFQI